jgi:nucleotide-binding universal stress UspA family protein
VKRFKNILVVAADDQPETKSLIYAAIDLARRNHAAITVFSVVERIPQRRRFADRGGKDVDLQELLIRTRLEELKEATPQSEVPVYYEVATGMPYLEIIERVELFGHDLVLTVPMPPLRRAGLGGSSTTMHLLRKCPVPVWVHSPYAATADAIAVAIGPVGVGEPADSLNIKLLELAGSLARIRDSELHIIHAWRLEGETMLRSKRLAYSADEIEQMGHDARDEARRNIEGLLEQVEVIDDSAQIHLRKGHAGDVLVDAIEEINPSTVVMGTVARTGVPGLIIGNTAERVMATVDRAILAVKPNGFVSPVKAVSEWDPVQMPY